MMTHEIEFHCHYRRAYSVHVDGELIGTIRRIGVGAAAVWSINIPGLNVNVCGRGAAAFLRGSTEPSRVHFRHIADARNAVVDHINAGRHYPMVIRRLRDM